MIDQRTVEAGGVTFGVLAAGRGRPVILLHGFPDSAWTWEEQLEALAEAGFEALAPFLPGYPPSGLGERGEVEIGEVVAALAALIEGAGDGPVALVGHDWGATLTYALSARRPDLVERATVIAVPHPAASARVLELPELIQENFHHWFFQLPDLPEAAIRAGDFALVDYLWEQWTLHQPDREHVRRVKQETLGRPGGVEAAIGYYRAMYRALAAGELNLPPITVPTLAVFGSADPHHVLVGGQEQWFDAEHRLELVDGARHFVQREQPRHLNALLLDWLEDG